MRTAAVLAAFLTVFLAPTCSAAIISPGQSTPGGATPITWARGDAGSTYVHWNFFTMAEYPVDSTPDVSNAAGYSFAGTLRETTGTAFATGSGNIYSPAAATDFVTTFQGPALAGAATTRVVAQFRTLGGELDRGSILLNGLTPSYTEELERLNLGGFGGAQVDYLAAWDLAGSLASYTLDFNAAGSSMSLDQLALDSFSASAVAVPEPASLATLSAVGAGIALRRRRSRKRAKGEGAEAARGGDPRSGLPV